MYFGSVRFFKHLILTVTALLILIPITVCIVLGIDNSNKSTALSAAEKQNSNLSALVDYYSDGEPLDVKGICAIMDKAGISTEEFINYLYDEDKDAFEDILKNETQELTLPPESTNPTATEKVGESGDGSAPVASETTTSTTAKPVETTTTESDTESAYAEICPDLICSETVPENYNDDKKYIYLTFDDGPSIYTESILDYLDKYNIKATFFVVPDKTEECAERLNEIIRRGHTIGVHSASHDYKKIYASVEAFLDDFETAYNLIYEQTGVKCTLYRFPGGSINDYNTDTRDDIIAEMTRRGFVYFDWNVDSLDCEGANWTTMYNTVLSEVDEAPRAVVLMHDSDARYNTILVLEDIIKALQSDPKNYMFDKLTGSVKPIQF